MSAPAQDRYVVDIQKNDGIGTTWIVRVYKKILFFRKRVSSDWFLDGAQAERFASQLREEIGRGGGLAHLRDRNPGWVWRRPAR